MLSTSQDFLLEQIPDQFEKVSNSEEIFEFIELR